MANKDLKTLNFGGEDTYILKPNWENIDNKPTNIEVTTESITSALGYTPAKKTDVESIAKNICYVTPQKYGAKGDGVTDDTVAINQCLAKNDFVFFPKGTYIINPTVAVNPKSNQTIVFENGAILKADVSVNVTHGQFYKVLYCKDIENTVIRGGHIIGDRAENIGVTSTDQRHGLTIVNCKNITVDGCTINEHRGDGLTVNSIISNGGDYETQHCENIKIVDCEIYNCLRHGAFVDGVDGLMIKDTYIHDCYELSYSCAIDFEPHYDYTKTYNVLLDGLKTENCGIGVSFNRKSFENSILGITVENCTLDKLRLATDGDHIVNKSNIGIVSCSICNSVTVSNCVLNTLYMIYTAKKITANNCVFNCVESDSKYIALQFESSANASSIEFECNNCVFNSYVSNIKDTTKPIFLCSLNPLSFVLNN